MLSVPAEAVIPPEPAALPPTPVPAELAVPADGCVVAPAPPAFPPTGSLVAEQPIKVPTKRAASWVCFRDLGS